jgi:hypothetical protein
MGSPTEARGEERVANELAWNPRVACRTLDETAFILLNSRMVRLNEVGTFIWEQYENGSTIDAVIALIVEEFETTQVQATEDARSFVGELVQKDLLIPVDENGRTP